MARQGGASSVGFFPLSSQDDTCNFCCGEKSVNDFFRKEAWRQHNRTAHRVTCASLSGVARVAGFFSLACVTEDIKKLPGTYARLGMTGQFPCLQLAWLGVGRDYQGMGIGTAMLGKLVSVFAEVGEKIGLPHLIVVPVNEDVKRFYKSVDFSDYDHGRRMFLPLQIALDATR